MNWFKVLLAEYSDYYDQIEYSSHANPKSFNSWFPGGQDRIYLDFSVDVVDGGDSLMTPDDHYVVNFLQENGYPVKDYRGGYLETGARINKAINSILKRQSDELLQRQTNGEEFDYQAEYNSIQNDINHVRSSFTNSQYRSNKATDDFYVVVSQNPHDIGSMSTDKSWESCMTLDGGSNRKHVYKEVASGGLISYLVKKDDKEIENPVARILIKRFEDNQGGSIALPENSVYPDDAPPGYYRFLSNWLTNQQPEMKEGVYRMQGGGYSDTFQDTEMVSPNSPEGMMKWFRGEGEDAKYSKWNLVDSLSEVHKEYTEDDDEDGDGMLQDYYDDQFGGVEDYNQTFETKEEAEAELKNLQENFNNSAYDIEQRESISELSGDSSYLTKVNEYGEPLEEIDYQSEEAEQYGWETERFSVFEDVTDNRDAMKMSVVKGIIRGEVGTYPEDFLKEVKDYVIEEGSRRNTGNGKIVKEFLNKYPHLISQEEVMKMNESTQFEFIKNLGPSERAPYLAGWESAISESLNVDSFLNSPSISRAIGYFENFKGQTDNLDEAYYEVHTAVINEMMNDIIRPLGELYDPIPEALVQKTINFAKELSSKEVIQGNKNYNRIHSSIVDVFSKTHTDTPSVQSYYKSLLPLWDVGAEVNHYGFRNISTSNLGMAISNLGENGQGFIPDVKIKIQDAENYLVFARNNLDNNSSYKDHQNVEKMEKEVERRKYVLDCLENKQGRSDKYKFFRSNSFKKVGNWYKRIF